MRSSTFVFIFSVACLTLAGAGCSDSDPGSAGTADAAIGGSDVAFAPSGDVAAGTDSAANPETGPPLDSSTPDLGTASPDVAAPDTPSGDSAQPDASQPPPDTGPVASGKPSILVDPESHTFSYISPLPAPLTKQVNIYNAGDGPLHLTKLAFVPGSSQDYGFVLLPPLPKTIQPGKTTLVQVRFQEIDGGQGTLVVESNDANRPHIEIPFTSYKKAETATPEPCGGLNPASLNFGSVVRGHSKVLKATLTNCGQTAPLKLTNITRGAFFFIPLSDEFQIDNMPGFPLTLAPGDTYTFDVSYTPKLAGPDAGHFLLHTDDPNEPQMQLQVSGLGTPPPVEELGLAIRLSWDENLCDVDSHLIMPGGALFDCHSDCFFGNPSPDWGVQGDWLDDPFLDVDDVDGFGPENINISEPQPGTYKYVAHYWDDTYEDSWSTSTNATVEVLSYGQVIATFGPQYLDGTTRTWDVFEIEWPSGAITPLGAMTSVPSSSACFGFP